MQSLKTSEASINLLLIEKDDETRSGIERFFQMSGHRIMSVAAPSEVLGAIVAEPDQDLILFNTYSSPPESFKVAYDLHCQPEIVKIPMLITSVHDHELENLADPNVDSFTVGYITEVSNLDELESLMNCLKNFKKSK